LLAPDFTSDPIVITYTVVKDSVCAIFAELKVVVQDGTDVRK